MQRYLFVLVACLSLGLAPFAPEPHIVGKLRWVLGGAHGMAAMDWLDLLFHGAPWLALLGMAALDLARWIGRRRSVEGRGAGT